MEGMVPTIKDTEYAFLKHTHLFGLITPSSQVHGIRLRLSNTVAQLRPIFRCSKFGAWCISTLRNKILVSLTFSSEIITVARNTWARVSAFSSDEALGAITALALSVNGVYLASACKSGISFVGGGNETEYHFLEYCPHPTQSCINSLSRPPQTSLRGQTAKDRLPVGQTSYLPQPQAPSRPSHPLLGPSVPVRRQATPLLFAQDEDTAGKGQRVRTTTLQEGTSILTNKMTTGLLTTLAGVWRTSLSRSTELERWVRSRSSVYNEC